MLVPRGGPAAARRGAVDGGRSCADVDEERVAAGAGADRGERVGRVAVGREPRDVVGLELPQLRQLRYLRGRVGRELHEAALEGPPLEAQAAAGEVAVGECARRVEGEHARDAREHGARLGQEPLELKRGLGRKRGIQVLFNMSVPRARVPEKASMLRDRSER